MKERRTVFTPLLKFLKNPNKESDFDNDLDTTLIKLYITRHEYYLR